MSATPMITKQHILDRISEINLNFPDSLGQPEQVNTLSEEEIAKNEKNYDHRLAQLKAIKSKILKSCEILTTNLNIQQKQYFLYLMCNRARLWRIKREDLFEIFFDTLETPAVSGVRLLDQLTFNQIESALKGYGDDDGTGTYRKISNKRVFEKTGVMEYSAEFEGNHGSKVRVDCFTAKSLKSEVNKLITRLNRESEKEKICAHLRRYARRNIRINKSKKDAGEKNGEKVYTIDRILELLEKNGFKISRSTLYSDPDYRMILFGSKNGIKIRKHRGKKGYTVSSIP